MSVPSVVHVSNSNLMLRSSSGRLNGISQFNYRTFGAKIIIIVWVLLVAVPLCENFTATMPGARRSVIGTKSNCFFEQHKKLLPSKILIKVSNCCFEHFSRFECGCKRKMQIRMKPLNRNARASVSHLHWLLRLPQCAISLL